MLHGPLGEDVLAAYCDAVRCAFAAAGGPRVERDHRIAGHVVRLASPSARVADTMGAALAHLRIETATPPDLTICAWDAAGPNAASGPPSPWGWYARRYTGGKVSRPRFNRHGELTDFRSAGVYTAFRLWPHKLRVFDSRRHQAFYWTEDIDAIPDYERCAPVRKILSWWTGTRGLQTVHAAAVGTEETGVLLAGEPGSGKSTAALACMGSRLRFAGDDYCVLEDGSVPRVSSLYNSAKVKTMDELTRFPGLAGAAHSACRRAGEEPFVFLHRHRPEFLSAGFPLRALLLPRVTGTVSPRLEPVSRATGLASLAPSTLRLFPGERDAMERIARLVSRIPSYRLEMGPDLRRIPRVILDLLGRP